MTPEELVTKIAHALIYDKGEVLLDIDAERDLWYFEKPTSPADIVRFVFDKTGLTPLLESHKHGTRREMNDQGYWLCEAHSDGVMCCVDLLLEPADVQREVTE